MMIVCYGHSQQYKDSETVCVCVCACVRARKSKRSDESFRKKFENYYFEICMTIRRLNLTSSDCRKR